MMRKRFVCLLVVFLLLATVMPVQAVEFDFQSEAQLLMDVGSKRVLYEHNAHEKLYRPVSPRL